jgi:NAD(P)-dependent dehydrogenase (short-subunit alcohol dehydrogenase family)
MSVAKTIDRENRYGMSDEALANAPTVYRSDLLKDQVLLISGGGSGLGRAMSFLAAKLGAKVMICGRREDKLVDAAAAIGRLLGAEVGYQAMSIRDPESVEALLAATWDRFGRLDALVNNAGGQFPQAAIDFSDKGWRAVIDTNLNGTWYMMQRAARLWQQNDTPGSITNIVANVARGMPQVAHTCAARAGVIHLSKTVSTEWAPLNIRVNCVSPGSVETEGFNVYEEAAAAEFRNSNPMKRCGDAYDIAEAVVYLIAPSGKFVTGEVLTVDGGNQQWGDVWPAGIPDYFNIKR